MYLLPSVPENLFIASCNACAFTREHTLDDTVRDPPVTSELYKNLIIGICVQQPDSAHEKCDLPSGYALHFEFARFVARLPNFVANRTILLRNVSSATNVDLRHFAGFIQNSHPKGAICRLSRSGVHRSQSMVPLVLFLVSLRLLTDHSTKM